ncbi:MAG: Eco57I restriction-modification methylase domain-containing protein, partial [Brevinema sp.]
MEKVQQLLKSWDEEGSDYYQAILQNLFFATLNTEMNTAEKSDNRKFRNRGNGKGSRDQNFMSHSLYRYEKYFRESQEFLNLCDNIPFLNGGLFECLDRHEGAGGKSQYIRIDGFS